MKKNIVKKRRVVLGLFQVACGFVSMSTLLSPMLERGWLAVIALIVFSTYSIVAGLSLLLGTCKSLELSLVNQAIQVLGFYTPWFSFVVIHGINVTISQRLEAAVGQGERATTFSCSALIPGSICDLALGSSLSGCPNYGITFNFVAAGILVFLVFKRRQARA